MCAQLSEIYSLLLLSHWKMIWSACCFARFHHLKASADVRFRRVIHLQLQLRWKRIYENFVDTSLSFAHWTTCFVLPHNGTKARRKSLFVRSEQWTKNNGAEKSALQKFNSNSTKRVQFAHNHLPTRSTIFALFRWTISISEWYSTFDHARCAMRFRL